MDLLVISRVVGVVLAVLLDLVARGEPDPQIGWRGSWDRIDEAVLEVA